MSFRSRIHPWPFEPSSLFPSFNAQPACYPIFLQVEGGYPFGCSVLKVKATRKVFPTTKSTATSIFNIQPGERKRERKKSEHKVALNLNISMTNSEK